MAITDEDIRAVQMEAAQLDREAARLRLHIAEIDERSAIERLKATVPMRPVSLTPLASFSYPGGGTPLVGGMGAKADAED